MDASRMAGDPEKPPSDGIIRASTELLDALFDA
jgi:hypothetical protein